MSKRTHLVAEYNTHLLASGPMLMGSEAEAAKYPDSLKPYFTDDVVLYEPESLPWGGAWKGREGFLGEGRAFLGVFGDDYDFEIISDTFFDTAENSVFHEFEINIMRRGEPHDVYVWRGIENYEFSGEKCSRLDVFYKDTAGLMKFLGV